MKELNDSLKVYQKNLKKTVFRALTLIESEILQNLRSRSGLKVRSGSLLNSVGASKQVNVESDGTVTGQIGSQGVPYAAIHEFGGTTKPHAIEPRNKKALSFQGNNGHVFARFVNHPGSKIPARPYLRPALAAKKDEIFEVFGLMLSAAFKE